MNEFELDFEFLKKKILKKRKKIGHFQKFTIVFFVKKLKTFKNGWIWTLDFGDFELKNTQKKLIN